MSRIRSVHPGFFKDERLVPCSAFARLLFIGLGVEADDKGIFEWKPVTLKMNIFPGDNVDVVALLAELVEAGSVHQYEMSGRKYGAIRNFRKFQKPKTPNSIHPITPEIAEYVSLPADSSEADGGDGEPFPPKGEKSPQMEDGGGRVKEESPPKPPEGGARRRREKNGASKIFELARSMNDGNEGSQQSLGGDRPDAGGIPQLAISDH